jgi:peptidoglycan/LPS O-acetylase OafA/YrhL
MGVIRFFLALSVALWHIPNRNFNFVDAGVSVIFFFIISGFYMSLIINERYSLLGSHAGKNWVPIFLLSRFCRLYPPYFCVLIATIMIYVISGDVTVFTNNPNLPSLAQFMLILQNTFIIGQDFFQVAINSIRTHENNKLVTQIISYFPLNYFNDSWMLIGQGWSLASELLFYILAPFVVGSKSRIIILLILSLSLRWSLIFACVGFSSLVWGYNFFPSTLCFFLMGALSYQAYLYIKNCKISHSVGAAILFGIVCYIISSIYLWHGVFLINKEHGFDTIDLWVSYMLFAISIPFIFIFSKNNRVDRFIGEMSYPLYLVHGIMIGLVFTYFKTDKFNLTIIAIISSIFMSYNVYFFIDRRVDNWRHRFFSDFGTSELFIRPGRIFSILALVLVFFVIQITFLQLFAKPQSSPPILVITISNYNIVRFQNKYYGVPHGIAVDWNNGSFNNDARIYSSPNLDEVIAEIRTR